MFCRINQIIEYSFCDVLLLVIDPKKLNTLFRFNIQSEFESIDLTNL